MDKIQVITKLKEEKLVAVIRDDSKERVEKIADAVIKGGINFIEITMTVPGAIDIIKELSKKYEDNKDIVIGAGTVLDSETARLAILAGAKYIVSPALNVDTIKMCNRYSIAIMPGIMAASQIVEALELGVDILKVFPSGILGPNVIKAFKEPFPQANFIATGDFTIDSIGEWLTSGAIAVGIATPLTLGAKTGNYDLITKNAVGYVNAVKCFKRLKKEKI